MRRLFIITGLMFILQGCVKEVVRNANETIPAQMIVDAIITDEVKSHQIRLSWSVSQLNQSPMPVAGANVLISNEDSIWTLTEQPAKSGVYVTPPTFFTRKGKSYTLLVSYDDQIVSAKASMVPGSYFQELRYQKNDKNNLYYVDWVANAFSTENAAMWELLIDWSMAPGYESLDSLETHARMLFYTLPTLDVSEVFAPRMESDFFPAGTNITERRYSLTPQHAEFIREMLLETNWSGGLFTVAPANVGTNLSGDACGFFGACAVTELSVIVK